MNLYYFLNASKILLFAVCNSKKKKICKPVCLFHGYLNSEIFHVEGDVIFLKRFLNFKLLFCYKNRENIKV